MDDAALGELVELLRRAGDVVAITGADLGEVDGLRAALHAFIEGRTTEGPTAYARSARAATRGAAWEAAVGHPVLAGTTACFPPLAVAVDGTHVRVGCRFGAAHEGPPGMVHGGFVAAVFDVAASRAAATVEPWSMTRRIQVRYLRPTFLDEPLEVQADATAGEGRSIHVRARMRDEAGRSLASATAEFVRFEPERFTDRDGYRPDGAALES